MGGFINATENGLNPASESEVRCGRVLASIVAAKWVVVLVNPSGHRSAVGGSGATSDYMVYTGGAGKTHQQILEDESYWGTIDAYTPEAKNDGDQAAKMVRDKLSTQATAVIVDLVNIRNEVNRKKVVTRVIAMVNKEKKGRMVIFTFEGELSAVNPVQGFNV